MQTIILAGGKGTRLKPLTDHTPKPMILISGKPFLLYILNLIKDSITDDILLLVGYLGSKIEEYFGNGSEFGLNIEYSYEKTLLGTGGALKNAKSKIKNEFLLLNGDTYLLMDYEELIDCFHKCNCMGIIVAYDNSEKIAPNNMSVSESGLVTGYNKKDPEKMTHVDAGVMVFKKAILDYIPKNKTCSLEEDIFPTLIKENKLFAFSITQRFYDMGNHDELEILKEVLK